MSSNGSADKGKARASTTRRSRSMTPAASPARQRTAATSRRPIATTPASARAPKAARPDRPPAVSGNAVKIGDPVEREAEHQLARARRPAERGLGLAHPLPGADDPPHDVGSAPARRCRPRRRTGAARRSATSTGRAPRRARRARAASAPRPSASSPAGRAAPAPSRSAAARRHRIGARLTWPRACSQPSGLSARLTVTRPRRTRAACAARRAPGRRTSARSISNLPSIPSRRLAHVRSPA